MYGGFGWRVLFALLSSLSGDVRISPVDVTNSDPNTAAAVVPELVRHVSIRKQTLKLIAGEPYGKSQRRYDSFCSGTKSKHCVLQYSLAWLEVG
mgnify:CR=1 FL=1